MAASSDAENISKADAKVISGNQLRSGVNFARAEALIPLAEFMARVNSCPDTSCRNDAAAPFPVRVVLCSLRSRAFSRRLRGLVLSHPSP